MQIISDSNSTIDVRSGYAACILDVAFTHIPDTMVSWHLVGASIQIR